MSCDFIPSFTGCNNLHFCSEFLACAAQIKARNQQVDQLALHFLNNIIDKNEQPSISTIITTAVQFCRNRGSACGDWGSFSDQVRYTLSPPVDNNCRFNDSLGGCVPPLLDALRSYPVLFLNIQLFAKQVDLNPNLFQPAYITQFNNTIQSINDCLAYLDISLANNPSMLGVTNWYQFSQQLIPFFGMSQNNKPIYQAINDMHDKLSC